MDLNVVLVRTKYSGNVGRTSRAMSNMGVKRLILVEPQCMIDGEARKGAAGGVEPLEGLITYPTLREFYEREGEGVRIGFSARSRLVEKNFEFERYLESVPQIFEEHSLPMYLFFGPEDHGLSANDVEDLHALCELPVYGEFRSLSLPQAVLLSLFVFKNFSIRTNKSKKEVEKASSVDLVKRLRPKYFPDESLRQWLDALGFDLSARRMNAFKVLKRLLLGNHPSVKELRIFHVVVRQTIRKLNYSTGSKVKAPSGRPSEKDLDPGV